MKVEVDADELCQLREKAKGEQVFYGTPWGIQQCSNMQKQLNTLTEERDFWAEKCGYMCRSYDDLQKLIREAAAEDDETAADSFRRWSSKASSIGLNK